MRVAIVHYHLRGGGVTRVIRPALRVLAERGIRAVVLTGEPPAEPVHGPEACRVVPGLGYATAAGRGPGGLAAGLADAMRSAAAAALGGDPDLWHVHNHSLGKNPALTLAVRVLAEKGRRLLLQIHDFAEDGRPANYRALRETCPDAPFYPEAGHIHYAVLNRRDARFLAEAGADPSRLHVLPNPVDAPCGGDAAGGAPAGGPCLFLFPVRAIRRKNLGEILLWAAAAPPGHNFALTLAPRAPEARPIYERWKRLAAELRLPIEFEIGEGGKRPYAEILAKASWVVTTSVGEGFGMAFAEPWAAGRPVAGRNLPETTGDLADHGIRLDSLYDRLDIPAAWIDARDLRRRIEAALRDSWTACGRSATEHDVDRALGAAIRGDRVDFGRLDESVQEEVVRRLAAHPRLGGELLPGSLAASPPPPERIVANARAVLEHYGLQAFGRELVGLYETVASSAPGPLNEVSRERLLERFLDPERFRLLMS